MNKRGYWDIRVTPELRQLCGTGRYWYRLNRDQAEGFVRILARLYEIPPPKVKVVARHLRAIKANCCYFHKGRYPGPTLPEGISKRTIGMFSRNHVRGILHEFYHCLDLTQGENDSDDKDPYAWIWSELMYASMRGLLTEGMKLKSVISDWLLGRFERKGVNIDGVLIHIEGRGQRFRIYPVGSRPAIPRSHLNR